jgi:anthranilate synthase/aminodeoxychorismate synthase-like glutamine amidotransferase
MKMIESFAGKLPIPGVCLGHQSITEVFGGKVVRADRQMHGKTSQITHDRKGVFAGVSHPVEVGRYHSLIAKLETMPDVLEVTAVTPEGEIMGLRHKTLMIEGVQFHPESVLTPEGPKMMGNFLKMVGGKR